MINFDVEKEKLTQNLSEQYSQDIINIEEYERILEYINKIETKKEISIIEKIIQENNANYKELTITQRNKITIPETKEKHLSMFSWRTSNVKPINGNGGKYISLFGTNRIIVDNLPEGRTVIDVKSIFGLTEIIVSNNVKIITKIAPIFSGVFSPNKINNEEKELPELYIIGKAIFGNVTIKTVGELKKEEEYAEKFKQKILDNMLDKINKK
jgi:hypothetical protein